MSRRHVSTLYTNAATPRRVSISTRQHFSTTSVRRNTTTANTTATSPPTDAHNGESSSKPDPPEKGAMARRLSEMTEQAMLEGGRAARRDMQHAGFSEDLKQQLEERVAAAAFKSEYAGAHSIVHLPPSAGQGTQSIASAQPWSGTESTHDITLRMLDDSRKRIRTTFKPPHPQPKPVDMRLTPKPKESPGLRLATAKELTATYTLLQQTENANANADKNPSDTSQQQQQQQQRQAFRQELHERFSSTARPMPATLQGLTALANERIEDAIARGQFKKIRRGKGVNTQTDHNANSPFIDTTEYFMNKLIQKQEIVPPWIEKQQDLKREVDRFRARLRSEWRRHAARLVASEGGELGVQMRRAEAYAEAERRLDGAGTEPPTQTRPLPIVPPLRDPQYLHTERSFLALTIKNINAQTRTYNLQAPPVAQKPYLNLERELSACYADVAPTLADEIKRRATERARPRNSGPQAASIFESLSTSHTTRVYDEDKAKGYGFKQFWRDLFSKDGK
ncbi:hypothetical protein BO70DRAFT_428967 [Aspergillus heteromorphus CBS 117.55]|uniref:DnaJ homologue subfamily C member 28 conserved domain-containing protein n=1 Tax=Aspergillus heteromorphus CBS 117.55 TaxID=1448321 RepID=A0A317W9R0_9EURO|nr:uncharacterized protein BO70DRAFT_428967 [Aspergillus heteromorphus CBS 117.55]PWY82899.1 hypothetical protein BO70DRAFT_428967 [Aspergillus heteromorphus CBS 117.55]